jgi:hypothetical protein
VSELADALALKDDQLEDLWARVGELERQVMYLQGQLTAYQASEGGGLLGRLRRT